MRISDQGTLNDALRQIQVGQERLAQTQHRAASGLMVERPSDDPVAHAQVEAQEEQLLHLDGYNRNIGLIRTRLNATESALQGFQGVLTRLRELTMMSLNEVTRTSSIDIEAQQLYDELTRMLNQTYTGDHLFGGLSGAAPFSGTRFVGDNQKRAVEVSPLGATLFGVSAQEAFGVLPGQDAFQEIAAAVSGMRTGNRAQVVAGLGAIDRQMSQLSESLATLGAQYDTLSVAEQANGDYALALKKSINLGRDIDPAAVYSQLSADRYAMEATYAVLGARGQLSLLKYL